MTGQLAGKRALITGSSHGVGLAAAHMFAAQGAEVVLHGNQNMADADQDPFEQEVVVDHDECNRPGTTLDGLSSLAPVFKKPEEGGTVTAGNASQLSDGASAVLDPAVLDGRLIAAGDDPASLGRETLAGLARDTGARSMVVAELQSYAADVSGRAAIFEERETTVAASLPSCSYFVRVVDLESGSLAAAATRYLDVRPEPGWFGVVRTRSSRRILSAAALGIWEDFGLPMEERHDR